MNKKSMEGPTGMNANSLKTNDDACHHLCFVMNEADLAGFFLLLQRGFTIKARVGCSVATFLREQLGVGPDTLDKIQSIFLNSSPVDDLETAMITDGARLALSAAMPGLVGATMRRGGAYASFRSAITYHETAAQCVSGDGHVRIILFNLLMDELGPGFLKKGFFVSSKDLSDFLAEQSPDFWRKCRHIRLDNEPVKTSFLADRAWLQHNDRVFLSVHTEA